MTEKVNILDFSSNNLVVDARNDQKRGTGDAQLVKKEEIIDNNRDNKN